MSDEKTIPVEQMVEEINATLGSTPDAPVQTETALDPKDGGSVGDHERQREETD